jgi:hypothetical protein
MIELPITHDESSTYINFSGRGLIYSMGYYSATNNHVLNSMLAFFTCKIPVKDTLALRIPAFLAGIGAIIVLWFFLRNHFRSHVLSIFVWGIYCNMFFLTDYGVMARGYSFILLFFIVSYYSVLRIQPYKLGNNLVDILNHRWFCVFILSSIAGFYTIPTYLYAHMALCFIYAVYYYGNSKSIIVFVKANLLIIAIVMLLYLPVVMISGIDSLINNRAVQRISSLYAIKNLYSHFSSTFSVLFINFRYNTIIFIMASIYLIIRQPNKLIVSALLTIFIAPLFIVLQGVIPFERTWIYLTLPGLIVFISLFKIDFTFNSKFYSHAKWFVPLYVCSLAITFHKTQFKMRYQHSDGMSTWELKNLVYSEIKEKQQVVSMDYISHTILDYYRLRNKAFNLELYRPESWNTSADAAFLIPKNTIIITQKEVGEKYINRVQDGWRLKRLGVVYNVYENKQ